MTREVIVWCPDDGEVVVSCPEATVDRANGVVGFTCPTCLGFVRHRCGDGSRAVLDRTLHGGAAPGRLGQVLRPTVCEGRPMTSIEAFGLYLELSRPGALEAALACL